MVPGEGVGRGNAERFSTGEGSDCFANFFGRGGVLVARIGEARAFVLSFSLFVNTAGGVTLSPGGDFLDALLGIGLTGLSILPGGGSLALGCFGVVESLSSSELECFLRVPAQAGDLGVLSAKDLGLYFGRAELVTVLLVLGRKTDELRVMVACCCGEAGMVASFIPVSSTDDLGARMEELDRLDWVMVLWSGDVTCFAGLSCTDSRTVTDLAEPIVLVRLAWVVSFAETAPVVDFLLSFFASLFITSAIAFPTVDNVKD